MSKRGWRASGRRDRGVKLGLERLEERLVPSGWLPQTSGTTQSLSGVWGSGPGDFFALGNGGTILHTSNDGQSWNAQPSGTGSGLSGVWGSGPGDVFAVG